MSRELLHYAPPARRRRWLANWWVLEVLEVLLAFGMLLAILLMMAVAVVLICYRQYVLASVSLASIPVIIALCFEAADVVVRARRRIR